MEAFKGHFMPKAAEKRKKEEKDCTFKGLYENYMLWANRKRKIIVNIYLFLDNQGFKGELKSLKFIETVKLTGLFHRGLNFIFGLVMQLVILTVKFERVSYSFTKLGI